MLFWVDQVINLGISFELTTFVSIPLIQSMEWLQRPVDHVFSAYYPIGYSHLHMLPNYAHPLLSLLKSNIQNYIQQIYSQRASHSCSTCAHVAYESSPPMETYGNDEFQHESYHTNMYQHGEVMFMLKQRIWQFKTKHMDMRDAKRKTPQNIAW